MGHMETLWDVFISYAKEDEKIAKTIANALFEEFYVWYDEINLIGGKHLDQAITAGLNCSMAGLILLIPTISKISKSL